MIEKNWKRENICERKMHKEKKNIVDNDTLVSFKFL